ncbi:MAG TPA: hypothetical protein VKT18_07715 [Acidimicrobiales bacterium]|nr:hypothetical protein [Acidimicrobiales bacterium]
MTYCTVVEFEWADAAARSTFEAFAGRDEAASVEGRLVRVVGIDDAGARAIEVWATPDDARRFAESTAPGMAGANLPAPSRVFGFEVDHLDVAAG